jgi:hypothetical protein
MQKDTDCAKFYASSGSRNSAISPDMLDPEIGRPTLGLSFANVAMVPGVQPADGVAGTTSTSATSIGFR